MSSHGNRSNNHSMVMGDNRASGYQTTNDAHFAHFMQQEASVDTREALEVDKEYATAMSKESGPRLHECHFLGS